jgi:YHS domain-containing protein
MEEDDDGERVVAPGLRLERAPPRPGLLFGEPYAIDGGESKYYGMRFTVRITGLMFVTMVIAALIVNGIFSALGLLPTGPRPTRADIFAAIHLDYKLALNLLGVAIFAGMFWLTVQRGATDPVCGMKVDRDKAVTKEFGGRTYYFCSNHCLHAFEADPDKYLNGNAPAPADHGHAAHAHH